MSRRIVGFTGSHNRPYTTGSRVVLVTALVPAHHGASTANHGWTKLQPGLCAATALDELGGPRRAILADVLPTDANPSAADTTDGLTAAPPPEARADRIVSHLSIALQQRPAATAA